MDSTLPPLADRHPMAELIAWSFLIVLAPLLLAILEAILCRYRAADRHRSGATDSSELGRQDDDSGEEVPPHPNRSRWRG